MHEQVQILANNLCVSENPGCSILWCTVYLCIAVCTKALNRRKSNVIFCFKECENTQKEIFCVVYTGWLSSLEVWGTLWSDQRCGVICVASCLMKIKNLTCQHLAQLHGTFLRAAFKPFSSCCQVTDSHIYFGQMCNINSSACYEEHFCSDLSPTAWVCVSVCVRERSLPPPLPGCQLASTT